MPSTLYGPVRRALVLVLLAACTADAEQHEITEPGELLTDDGTLREPGWAPTQLLHWDPSKVADPDQLRMWDFVTLH